MRTGEEIALGAMRKEFSVLSRKADRAKKEADECVTVGSELIAIHEEFVEIVKAKATGEAVIKKLEVLQTRSNRAEKIRKKSLIKLLEKQSETEFERDNLGREIQMMEFSLSRRKAG